VWESLPHTSEDLDEGLERLKGEKNGQLQKAFRGGGGEEISSREGDPGEANMTGAWSREKSGDTSYSWG